MVSVWFYSDYRDRVFLDDDDDDDDDDDNEVLFV